MASSARAKGPATAKPRTSKHCRTGSKSSTSSDERLRIAAEVAAVRQDLTLDFRAQQF
jgi:hypothetical protein